MGFYAGRHEKETEIVGIPRTRHQGMDGALKGME